MRRTLIQTSFLQNITDKIMSEAGKLQREDALAQLFMLHEKLWRNALDHSE